ncbi:MAG TPA: hypothetical protein VH682_13785 [Gemmataceae bacterium]
MSLFVFAGPTALFCFHPLAFTVFPLVIGAARRFGQPAATRMAFVASGMAIWGTADGYRGRTFPPLDAVRAVRTRITRVQREDDRRPTAVRLRRCGALHAVGLADVSALCPP